MSRQSKNAWIKEAKILSVDEVMSNLKEYSSFQGFSSKMFEMIVSKYPELAQYLNDGFTMTDIEYWTLKFQRPQHVICPGCGIKEIHATSRTTIRKTCGSKECVAKVMLASYESKCLELYGVKHAWSVPSIIQKSKNTRIRLYGTLSNIEKQQQTLKENYGVEYTWQIPGVKEKSKQTNLERRGCEYALQSKEVRKKCKDTIEKHKQENPNYYQDIHHKAQETNIANGHDPNWNNQEQAKKTFIDHYGVDNNMKCEKGKKEYCAAIQKKYGKDYFVETEQFQQKHRINYKKKTGYSHQAQNPEVQSKMKKRYLFEDKTFDSLTEIALYIWLKDNNKAFEYQPKVSFTYEYDGKQFSYFPDFIIDGAFFEIKGDHFFKEDGTMFLPYRDKAWTDDQYMWMCGKYEAKHQCMIKNNVKILRHKDCKKYIDYVEQKYGKGYLAQFKKKPKNVQ